MGVRIEKYIWAVRLFKTRSLATKEVKNGKVKVNGADIKPSYEVKTKDTITIRKHGSEFQYRVLDLLEKRVGAKLVADYIEDITPAEELEKFKLKQLAQKQYKQQYGKGKPGKKDRKQMDDFWDELLGG